jgi:tRNA threonylcarbamoyladenosine biosynthesis protein TsaE
MGAGKTTFMQAIARVLGCKDRVSSPTFGLIHEYESETAGCIYHFDFYRIQTFKEAVETGFDEYVNSGCYCFIEWADVIADALPEDAVKVIIVVNEDNRSRIFRF